MGMKYSAVVVAAVSAVGFSRLSPGAIVTRNVALSGQTVPNPAYAGETFAVFGIPSINANGSTAFVANDTFTGVVTSGNNQNNTALFSEGPGSLTLLAHGAALAPNGAGSPATASNNSGTFSNFNVSATPVLNSAGAVLDYAQIKLTTNGGTTDSSGGAITGSNNTGFFSDRGGSFALVIRKADAAGTPSTSLTAIASTTLNNPVFSSGGKFASATTNADATAGGIVSDASGTIGFVARGDGVAPGTGGATFNGSSFTNAPDINGSGQTAFKAGLTGTGITTLNNAGIFSEAGGTLHLVIQAGQQVQGLAAGDSQGNFVGVPDFNNAGQTAFVNTLVNNAANGGPGDIFSANSGTSNANNGAMFAETTGGNLRIVAQKGTQAAGTPTGVVYSSFNAPVINHAGETAFACTLANSASGAGGVVSGSNNNALFSEGSGVISLVARSGSVAAGTPGDVWSSFNTIGIALNGLGEMAFTGTLVTGTGDVTGTANNQGMWAQDKSGTLQLVVRGGESFQVAPGDVRTVSTFSSLSPSGGEDGRVTSWNDAETVPVLLTFTDGSTGVFTLSVSSVPEPTVSLILLAATSLSLRRSRRTQTA